MRQSLAGALLLLAVPLHPAWADEPPPVTLTLKPNEAMVLVQALPKVACEPSVQGAILCNQVIQILLDIQQQLRDQPHAK